MDGGGDGGERRRGSRLALQREEARRTSEEEKAVRRRRDTMSGRSEAVRVRLCSPFSLLFERVVSEEHVLMFVTDTTWVCDCIEIACSNCGCSMANTTARTIVKVYVLTA